MVQVGATEERWLWREQCFRLRTDGEAREEAARHADAARDRERQERRNGLGSLARCARQNAKHTCVLLGTRNACVLHATRRTDTGADAPRARSHRSELTAW